jgi:DinB superfamily
MKTDVLRKEVVALLSRAQAHAMPDKVFDKVAPRLRHARPPGASHSVWEVLGHMRLAQEDILRYMTDPSWDSPSFPEGYWPDPKVEPDESAWSGAVGGFRADLAALVKIAQDPGIDLTAPLPHAPKHTYLRELLIVGDHNAYHAGQVVEIRRALGDWGPGTSE